MVVRFGLVTAALAAALSGCGKSSDSGVNGTGFTDTASGYAGLAFATVDAKYTASTLTYNRLSDGRLQDVSAGESGDPWLKWLGNKLYLFNRSATSLNVRTVDPRVEGAAPLAQVALTSVGDPHDAVLLDDKRMLLALYNGGKLVVVDPTTGATVQEITAAWDLGAGAASQLRPEAFHVRDAGDGTKEIYVLHQGIDSAFTADGSQAVFVLKDDGKTVTAVDLDAAKDKIQGIPLAVKSPAKFLNATADTALIFGECNLFDDAACKSGFETLTFATKAVDFTWDTASLGKKGNGGLVKGAGNDFYELMVKEDGKTKIVAKIDYAAKTATDVYTFKGESGCCALFFDDTSGTLYTGDLDPATQKGFFAVLKNGGGEPSVVELSGLPYTGVFIPK